MPWSQALYNNLPPPSHLSLCSQAVTPRPCTKVFTILVIKYHHRKYKLINLGSLFYQQSSMGEVMIRSFFIVLELENQNTIFPCGYQRVHRWNGQYFIFHRKLRSSLMPLYCQLIMYLNNKKHLRLRPLVPFWQYKRSFMYTRSGSVMTRMQHLYTQIKLNFIYSHPSHTYKTRMRTISISNIFNNIIEAHLPRIVFPNSCNTHNCILFLYMAINLIDISFPGTITRWRSFTCDN